MSRNRTDLTGVFIHYRHFFDPDSIKNREAEIEHLKGNQHLVKKKHLKRWTI